MSKSTVGMVTTDGWTVLEDVTYRDNYWREVHNDHSDPESEGTWARTITYDRGESCDPAKRYVAVDCVTLISAKVYVNDVYYGFMDAIDLESLRDDLEGLRDDLDMGDHLEVSYGVEDLVSTMVGPDLRHMNVIDHEGPEEIDWFYDSELDKADDKALKFVSDLSIETFSYES